MSKSKTSPRKFAEKIALLNKKEAEVTAEFVRIIKEVEETTRAPPIWQQNQHHFYHAQQASQSTARHQLPIRSSSVSDPNRVHYPRLSQFGPNYSNELSTSFAQNASVQSNIVQQRLQHQQQHNLTDTLQNDENTKTNSVEVPNIAIFPTEDERYQSTNYSALHHIHQPPPPAPASSLTQCAGFDTGACTNDMLSFSYNQRDDCSMVHPISAARSMPNIANLGLTTSPSTSASPPPNSTSICYNSSQQHQQQQGQLVDSSNNTSNSSEYMCNYTTQQPQLLQSLAADKQQVDQNVEQHHDYHGYQTHSPVPSIEPENDQMLNNCDDTAQSMYDDWQQQVLDKNTEQQYQKQQTQTHHHHPHQQYQPQQQVQHSSPQSLSPTAGTVLSQPDVDEYYHNQHLLEPRAQPIMRANSANLLTENWNEPRKALATPRINNYLSQSSEADCCGYLGGCSNNNSTSPCCSPRAGCDRHTGPYLTTNTNVVRSCSASNLKSTGESSNTNDQLTGPPTYVRQADVVTASPYQIDTDQNCS